MEFTFSKFDGYPGLQYGFSSRTDGSMHRHLHKENKDRYLKSIGIDPQKVVTPDLMHGNNARKVDENAGGTMIADVDGLVANAKGLFLSATSADCFIIYLFDPESPAIGIAHSGWRGTEKKVVKATVKLMQEQFGTKPEGLLAGIGPGIRKCHFDLKAEADALRFARYPDFVSRQPDRVVIDLPGIIKAQLTECGLKPENIEDSGLCTFCEKETYFSYRRDNPAETESMVAYIGLT